MSEYEDKATILANLHLRVLSELVETMRDCVQHKREHGTWPKDATENFNALRDRIKVINHAMRKLREEHEHAEALATTPANPFDGVTVPDHMPWTL